MFYSFQKICKLTKKFGILTIASMNPVMIDGAGSHESRTWRSIMHWQLPEERMMMRLRDKKSRFMDKEIARYENITVDYYAGAL